VRSGFDLNRTLAAWGFAAAFLSYFAIGYLTSGSLKSLAAFVPLVPAAGLFYVCAAGPITRRVQVALVGSLPSICLSVCLVLLLLPGLLFWIDPAFSFARLIFSTFFVFALSVGFLVAILYDGACGVSPLVLTRIVRVLVLFLLFLIAGQLIIPEWRSGPAGIRFTGGLDASNVAKLAWVCLILAQYCGTRLGWSYSARILTCLSVLIIVWSFSRSVWLGVLVQQFAYFILRKLLFRKPNDEGRRYRARKVVFVLGAILVVTLISYLIHAQAVLDFVWSRLKNVQNIQERVAAWSIGIQTFIDSPVVGKVGWWKFSHVLEQAIAEGRDSASSPHSLWVRLLVEGGLVAATLVALFFGYMFLSGLLRARKLFASGEISRGSALLSIAAAIPGFCAHQLGEDDFLVGTGSDFGHLLIAVIISIVSLEIAIARSRAGVPRRRLP
jgi:hypothetical protein